MPGETQFGWFIDGIALVVREVNGEAVDNIPLADAEISNIPGVEQSLFATGFRLCYIGGTECVARLLHVPARHEAVLAAQQKMMGGLPATIHAARVTLRSVETAEAWAYSLGFEIMPFEF